MLDPDEPRFYIDDVLMAVHPEGASQIRLRAVAGPLLIARIAIERRSATELPDLGPMTPAGPTPYRYRWETHPHSIYQMMLRAHLTVELADHHPEALALVPRIRAIAGRLLSAVASWPIWHPSQRDVPGKDDWDWNNWSNGLTGGILALCASILDRETDDRLRQIFTERQTRWIASRAFPTFRHWLRRSTNHGIVILASHLIGASIFGLETQPENADAETKLVTVLEGSLQDGSYIEGLDYYRFAVEHVFTAMWVLARAAGSEWPTYAAERLGFMRPVPKFLVAGTAASGKPWAAFGDNHLRHWNRTSSLRFAAAIGGLPEGAFHLPLRPRPVEANAVLARQLDPLPAFRPSKVGSRLTTFEANELAVVEFFTDGRRSGGLFVAGSTHQTTHNARHDCGGFAFEVDGKPVVSIHRREGFDGANCVAPLRDGLIVAPSLRRSSSGHLSGLSLEKGVHLIRTSYTPSRSERQDFGLALVRRLFVIVRDPVPRLFILSSCKVDAGFDAACTFHVARHGDYSVSTFDADTGAELRPTLQRDLTVFVPSAPARPVRRFISCILPAGDRSPAIWRKDGLHLTALPHVPVIPLRDNLAWPEAAGASIGAGEHADEAGVEADAR
ncbi:hypothetical protein A6302_01411 [Methylobrevis pamukkalensis]|uniref:Heparinase II/III-like protein n=2 Tax=Methylobrevis pamukkalensis TaxID=1439726 RepID=A0A1E3H4Q4_9HYPH|nr:hypothetical protein A6302_01411 [Methylobrevis pamukkalensis]